MQGWISNQPKCFGCQPGQSNVAKTPKPLKTIESLEGDIYSSKVEKAVFLERAIKRHMFEEVGIYIYINIFVQENSRLRNSTVPLGPFVKRLVGVGHRPIQPTPTTLRCERKRAGLRRSARRSVQRRGTRASTPEHRW